MTLYSGGLLDAFFEQVDARCDAVALEETSGQTISYGALGHQVDLIAANLARQGFRKGDRVMLLVRPSIRAILLALAAVRAGGVLVIADIAMGQDAFESRVRLAAPDWAFVETALLLLQKFAVVRRVLKRHGWAIPEMPHAPGLRIVGSGPRLFRPVRGQPYLPFSALLQPCPAHNRDGHMDASADAAIVFTSGTTGLPKGVVHTHGSLEAARSIMTEMVHLVPGDMVYSAHLHLIIPALCSGARAVIPPTRCSGRATVRHLMTYAVTIMYGTPAEFDDLLAYCSAANRVLPHSVKTVLLGAAPIPPSYAARFQDALAPHTRVWCLYGMTEVLPVCCTTLAEKARSVAHGDLIGHPFPGVMVRCAPDGELLVRAAHLCKGYLGGPPMVEHATGDLGRVDSDGCITLVGRKKDMIIRKGHNVYPTLFEPTIARIAGVRACSMIGVYNDRTSDEEVVLIVEVDGRHDEQRFRRFLQRELLTGPHSIDAYAQPDAILFMPVPVHGRSRKTDKEALRRILSRGYRSADPPRDGAAPHGASSGG